MRSHVIHKAKEIVAQVDIPVVVVAQCPMDMEDFAKVASRRVQSSRPIRIRKPEQR